MTDDAARPVATRPSRQSRGALLALAGIVAYFAWRMATAFSGPPIDPAVRPLLGTWTTTTNMGFTLTWTFAPDGIVHWDVDSDDFRAHCPGGLHRPYRLDRAVTPNRLDILEEPGPHPYEGIIEFADDSTLLVEMNMPGSRCKPLRPEEFSDDAWIMRRSDAPPP